MTTAATGVASKLQTWQPKPPKRRQLRVVPQASEKHAYIDAVWEAPLPRELKTVLICVATHSDRNGTGAFMFARTLGRWCGLKERQVRYLLAEGRRRGWLDVEYHGPTGRARRYLLRVPTDPQGVQSTVPIEDERDAVQYTPGVQPTAPPGCGPLHPIDSVPNSVPHSGADVGARRIAPMPALGPCAHGDPNGHDRQQGGSIRCPFCRKGLTDPDGNYCCDGSSS